MALDLTLATAIFGLYIGIILLLFGIVFHSITPKDKTRLFEQKPFLFLRCAFGALLSTWYCKLSSFLIGTWADNSHDKFHDGMSPSRLR